MRDDTLNSGDAVKRGVRTLREGLRTARIAAWVVVALIAVAGASSSITYVAMKTLGQGGAGTTTTTTTTTYPPTTSSAGTRARQGGGKPANESTATATQARTGSAATAANTSRPPSGGGAAAVLSYEAMLEKLSKEASGSGGFFPGAWVVVGPYSYAAPPLTTLQVALRTVAKPATTTEAGGLEGAVNVKTPPHSSTNVQVPGVGEADIVKNDGTYLYVVGSPKFVGGELRKPAMRATIYIVRAYPPSEMRVVGKVVVEGSVAGIYVNGDELVVINRTSAFWALPLVRPLPSPLAGSVPPIVVVPLMSWRTGVLAYNISDRSSPKLMWAHYVSGSYLTSRMIGNVVYVLTEQPALRVLKNGSRLLHPPVVDGKVLPSKKVRVVRISPLQPWLNGFVTVACVNAGDGAISASSYLMPLPQRVYVSRDSIYLLSTEWLFMNLTLTVLKEAVIPALPKDLASRIEGILSNSSAPLPSRLSKALAEVSSYLKGLGREDLAGTLGKMYSGMFKAILSKPLTATTVYRLSLRGMETALAARATVPGRVLDQFAMREERGYFILATTSTQYVDIRLTGVGWGGMPVIVPVMGTVNSVYVLNASSLKRVSELTGLAKGERVFSARFVGNYLFLVTYRSVDPLFAVNLTNPRRPEVVGYVKVPGFSRYLHPYGSHYLIGVGYMTEGGRVTGIKVSMYDVSNPKNISVAARVVIKATYAYTNVAWNYKAFLINAQQGYIAIPVTIYNYSSGRYSAGSYLYVIKVGNGSMKLLGRIEEAGVVRAAYIGNYVYAISRSEIKAAVIPTLKVVAQVKLG